MKKRIAALGLAGVLSMSLAACDVDPVDPVDQIDPVTGETLAPDPLGDPTMTTMTTLAP